MHIISTLMITNTDLRTGRNPSVAYCDRIRLYSILTRYEINFCSIHPPSTPN